MTKHTRHKSVFGRRVLAASTFLALAGAAYAERGVSLTGTENPGYARLVFKWTDGSETAPRVSAAVANQVLIVRFDEEITTNLSSLVEDLPAWAAVTRVDPDGRTVRIGLKRAVRLHTSTSIDLAAIDLIPEDNPKDPSDVVSPLVAERKRQAEQAKVEAIPPPRPTLDLELRAVHAGNTSKVTFYWPEEVEFETLSETDGELKVRFNYQADTDAAYLKINPPQNLAGFEAENTDKGYVVTARSRDGLPMAFYKAGNVVTLNISPNAQAATLEENIANQLVEGGIDVSAPKPASKPPVSEREAADAPKLTEVKVDAPAPKTGPIEIAGLPEEGVPGRLGKSAGTNQSDDNEVDEEAIVLGGQERKTFLIDEWVEPAPAIGVTDVKVGPIPNGLELSVAFEEPAPAAVFESHGVTWAVFAANSDLKTDMAALPSGFRVRNLRTENATMLRIESPKGLTVSATSTGTEWKIRFGSSGTRADRFIKPERRPGSGGRAEIRAKVPDAAGIVWFEDPAIGEELAAIVSYAPVSSSITSMETVELNLPATAQGLAVSPKSDSVDVRLQGETVTVSMSNRSRSNETIPSGAGGMRVVAANPAYIDFAGWGGLEGEEWFAKREELEAATTEVDIQTIKGSAAMMDLARFYIGHEMAFEALGVLNITADARPSVELDSQFLGLRGAANFLADRLESADADLSKGPLRGDPSASLWRGAVAARRADWERSADFFRASGEQAFAYPPKTAAMFASFYAETAFNNNDFDTARKQAEIAVTSGEGIVAERGMLVMAKLSVVVEGPEQGYAQFERLAEVASEPIAVRAELGRLEIGVEAKKITSSEAAAELESLRFRWRGDDVEMTTVGILADQYMEVGRFREALLLAQATALRDANAPGARELRIKLTDYFRRLYLDGEVNKLDPIQALALFYEFRELTPVGVDGDQMIRKLAQRLVAFDLLEPAAQLLQYQVDNRLRGVGKSALAVDLATIYLLDRRPDRALAAINTSRQPSIPRELAYERRKLEAAAYLELGRFDHVVELMDPLKDPDARKLMGEALMRDRKFEQAAQTYLEMLPAPGQASGEHMGTALKGAVAARMSKDVDMITRFRLYKSLFIGEADEASFDLITAQTDIEGTALSEAVRRLADAPKIDAFSEALKTRFEGGGTGGAP